jgi:hypothetical protein
MSAGTSQFSDSGLVLSYDLDNKKSNRGAPTMNMFYSQSLVPSVYAYVDSPVITSSIGAYGEQASVYRYNINTATNFARGKVDVAVSLNTPYTFTYLGRYNGNNTTSASYYASAGKPSPEAGNSITMSLDSGFQTNVGYGWVRYEHHFNIIGNTSPSCILTYGVTTGADNTYTGSSFDIYNFQLEKSGTKSEYTSTSRSVSGSLFDMVSGNAIGVSAVMFDSSSRMYFSASAHSASLPYNNSMKLTGSSGWTWDFWFKADSYAGYRGLYVAQHYSNPTGFCSLFFNPGGTSFRLNSSSGSALTGSDAQLDLSLTHPTIFTGSYYNTTLTYTGQSWNLYLNGKWASNAPWTGGLGNITTGQNIGTFWAGSWVGEIPVHRQWNRALSSSEIEVNYNSGRSRFKV